MGNKTVENVYEENSEFCNNAILNLLFFLSCKYFSINENDFHIGIRKWLFVV